MLVAVTAATTVTLTGCKSPPRTQEAIVHDTFRTTYNAALQAYESWNEGVIDGRVSKETQAKGDKAWNDFRAAFMAARMAASGSMSSPSTEQAKVLAAQFIALIRRI